MTYDLAPLAADAVGGQLRSHKCSRAVVEDAEGDQRLARRQAAQVRECAKDTRPRNSAGSRLRDWARTGPATGGRARDGSRQVLQLAQIAHLALPSVMRSRISSMPWCPRGRMHLPQDSCWVNRGRTWRRPHAVPESVTTMPAEPIMAPACASSRSRPACPDDRRECSRRTVAGFAPLDGCCRFRRRRR